MILTSMEDKGELSSSSKDNKQSMGDLLERMHLHDDKVEDLIWEEKVAIIKVTQYSKVPGYNQVVVLDIKKVQLFSACIELARKSG